MCLALRMVERQQGTANINIVRSYKFVMDFLSEFVSPSTLSTYALGVMAMRSLISTIKIEQLH